MNLRRREILAALDPVTESALSHPPTGNSTIRVKALSADTTEIMVYGAIGQGGWFDDSAVSAADMSKVLAGITTPHIAVRINSGGGDVFDGVAIHTLLSRHSSTITVYIDGLAASAASFIAMAGDRIVIARNAMMMVHDGMTFAYGNADTMTRTAELLVKVSDNIADMYAERAGGTAAEWRERMTVNGEDGTWYTGREAVDAGLADETTADPDDEEVAARVRNNLKRFTNAPTYRAAVPEKAPPADPEPPTNADDQGFALLAAFNFGS